MNTSQIKRFAQEARKKLITLVSGKLEAVLTQDSAALRDKAKLIQQLNEEIATIGKPALIDKVAYTWFNRLVALRFMDANDFQPLGINIISPAQDNALGSSQILSDIQAGIFPEDLQLDRKYINDILNGVTSSANPDNDIFRHILIAVCNDLHRIFPFLFERLDDYSELLLPDDLTSAFSIVADVVGGMSAEDCAEVEIIGWLYQFYISERKDEVFAAKSKVKKEDIPAATQLFTPRWIVEYMVQNTVGKLWLQNHPESGLKQYMPYYIESPEGNINDYLKIASVEEIKLLDQACGSGHILVYGFELFAKIYEEQGYSTAEIPAKIIENNLYGLEIDERAAQLAAFAITMKARQYYRRFYRNTAVPNVICYEDSKLSDEEISQIIDQYNIKEKDAFKYDLKLLEQATNLGSLIQPHTDLATLQKLQTQLRAEGASNDLFWQQTQEKLAKALLQLLALKEKYHCVVDNPPYMGGGNMNVALGDFVKKNYPKSKADLMACFMEAGIAALQPKGFLGMINQHSWMFLSSYEDLRKHLIDTVHFDTLLHLGPRTFPEIGGEVVQNAAFTFVNDETKNKGTYLRLVDFGSSDLKREKTLEAVQSFDCEYLFTANQKDFEKIPGNNIGYWLSENFLKIFGNETLGNISDVKVGLQTGSNEIFVRDWSEVTIDKFNKKWFPYNKGGEFRKWYGNQSLIVNWENSGDNIKNFRDLKGKQRSRPQNEKFYKKESVSWSFISAGTFGVRYYPEGFIFDVAGSSLFPTSYLYFIGFLNSKISYELLKVFAPTLNYQVGDIKNLPIIFSDDLALNLKIESNISISKQEWNSRETSWDFLQNELVRFRGVELQSAVNAYKDYWALQFKTLHQNEEELNRQFIDIYGLQDELTPDVPLEDITILKEETKIVDGQLVFMEAELIEQLLSYAVGCIFGRYSLDKEGLILANQGETFADYMQLVGGERFSVGGEQKVGNTKENKDEHNIELQGFTGMATEYAVGYESLSANEADAKGGNIQPNESDQKGFHKHTEQYSRRTSEGNEGVSSLSENSDGLIGRIGNPTDALRESGNATTGNDYNSTDRNQQYSEANQQLDGQTKNSAHQSLNTAHQLPFTFVPDEDNVIPVLEEEWFDDDIVNRVKTFIRAVWGDASYSENIQYIEDVLGKDLRKYLTKDFYKDHVKRYKKRPIYWQFSSPKGHFSVLIYMHRYTPDTLNQILNEYLRSFIIKVENDLKRQEDIIITGSAVEQGKARKRQDKLKEILKDCEIYERDVLYALAGERIAIDLDDGVLVNYNKFGNAITPVAGLNDAKTKAKVREFDWIDTTTIR